MQTPKPSNELQLLFNLLKRETPTSLEGVDMNILFDLFRRHRLFPMAAPILALLDQDERERWKKVIHSRTLRSMRQLTVLHRFLEALRGEGVEAVPLKGPVLAHMLFGNISERHSSDIDILVRDKDVQQCIAIAGREGFELRYPKAGLSRRQWSYYIKYKKDIGLFSKEEGMLIELHYHVENYLGLKKSHVDRLIELPEKTTIAGFDFLSMNRQQNFLYLAIHGSFHQFRRLFWLRDLAEAIRSWDLDHASIVEEARRMGIERMLGVSVMMAGEWFRVELPPAYKSLLTDNRKVLEKLRRSAEEVILGPEYPDRKGRMNHHLYMLRLKPGPAHFFRTAGEILNRWYIGRYLGGH